MNGRLDRGQRDALALLASIQNDAAVSAQMLTIESVQGSPTTAKLTCPNGVPVSAFPDGPAPGKLAVVDDAGELAGELVLWLSGGEIDLVEQTWYSEHPPTALPGRGSVARYRDLGFDMR
ncbi:MAG: hypothetical protein QM809_12545 [Gordonia sp. (in: high G+C Gram-positive bacteria)]|uniref:hypothetical protein n=1 Tax=Gordonia sp. (in: high G+C Gram-positive bacteria) TaxID=84139 RepID=UPI0039E4EA2C